MDPFGLCWKTVTSISVLFLKSSQVKTYSYLTEELLLASYLRGCAIMCQGGQAGIDMVIPMIVLPPGKTPETTEVALSDISVIIIQVKTEKWIRSSSTTKISIRHFDLRHISHLSSSVRSTKPYDRIWMPLNSHISIFQF